MIGPKPSNNPLKKLREQHPLPPFFPEGARILFLGSFPPDPKRWSMDFFYPNWQNDMWRIFGLVFFSDRDYFANREKKTFKKEAIQQFLSDKFIAVFDMALEVVREKRNASDQHLTVFRSLDLAQTLEQLPQCRAVVVTGQKALDLLALQFPTLQKPALGAFSEFHFPDSSGSNSETDQSLPPSKIAQKAKRLPFSIAQSKVVQSKVAQSKVAQSKVAQSKVVQSKVVQSKVAQSKVVQSEVAQSKVVQSKVAQSEVAQSEVASSPNECRTMRLYRMPSSSRAYPLPLEEKAAFYQKMFEELCPFF